MQHSEQYQVWQNAFVTLRRDSRDAAWACPEELNIEWGEEKEETAREKGRPYVKFVNETEAKAEITSKDKAFIENKK
jgi:hypothetical protein